MKILKNIPLLLLVLIVSFSCQKEIDNLSQLDNVSPPSNVSAGFDITQDNTGLVTIIPVGEGVTKFMVTFGDSEGEIPTEVGVSERITHTYEEGLYTVGIEGVGITGLTSYSQQEINVTFKAPENLVITIEEDPVNPRIISVSAVADFATVMDIYFGDQANEVPVTVLPGEAATNTYEEPGDYTIKVVARSGGEASTEKSETITISEASDPINLPITFESFVVDYSFTDFGNAASTVIDNPDPSGINPSARVAQSVKSAGAETWAGSFLTLETPIDFSSKKIFIVKVWSPKSGATVRLKVENLDNGDIFFEADAVTSLTNQWEELSYDFSDIDDNDYQNIVFFFDFGNPGDDATYYFDDVKLVAANTPPTSSVEDFEGEIPEFTAFGNIADIEVVTNPDQTGANTTANSAKLTKSAGSETWAGAYFEVGTTLDLDNYSKIKVSTWSPLSGIIVKLKLENEDASVTHEVDITNTVANAWENLIYDFSEAPAGDYVKVVIFFDFDNPGDGTEYYFDEIELVNDGGGSSSLIFEDFEGEPPVFTDFGSAVVQVISNPDPSGANTTGNVAEFTKPSGAETWAGSFFDMETPLDLTTYKKISIKSWSPKSGVVVRLKIENSANSEEIYELDLTTSTVNGWEEMVYDLSGAPDYTYDRFVIFFDFGNTGDDTIYYFDELALTN